VGSIDTRKAFLPQLGAVWNLTNQDELFANAQENVRQFINYGAGGLSPWSLSSQAGFDLFKATVKPETALTLELGYRGSRKTDSQFLTAIDGQVSAYHVDFSNRLLAVSSTPTINTINPGNPILANVGGVTTTGFDLGGTLHFGNHYSFYNALSYNRSTYNDNYSTGAAGTVIATAGKQVPVSPEWLEKFALTGEFGDTEAQLMGDYVGKRFATYTNDVSVKPYFLTSLALTTKLPQWAGAIVKDPKIRFTVTNLADRKGDLNVVASAPSNTTGGYATYPIPPRMFFVTFSASF
jgi:outer membrane receptor for Fe3+-dicitrate